MTDGSVESSGIHAYNDLYLDSARKVMARMLDQAVCVFGWELEIFYKLFLKSGIAARFGKGDFELTCGMSGGELFMHILEKTGQPLPARTFRYTEERSPEYWTGWALAYYQWNSGMTFSEIDKAVPITRIRNLYSPYHEMDIRQFCDKMDELYVAAHQDTCLKTMRLRAGLSQSKLADLTSIPVRTIQQYEQRQKNINNARAEYLIRLSRALYCRVSDLLEKVNY